jgi:hypothetical protein
MYVHICRYVYTYVHTHTHTYIHIYKEREHDHDYNSEYVWGAKEKENDRESIILKYIPSVHEDRTTKCTKFIE